MKDSLQKGEMEEKKKPSRTQRQKEIEEKTNGVECSLEQQILAVLENGSEVVHLLKKIVGEVVEEKLKVQSESGGVLKKLFSGSSANEWKVKFEAEHKEVGRLNRKVEDLEKVEQNLKSEMIAQKEWLKGQFVEKEKEWNGEKKKIEEKNNRLNTTIQQQGSMLEQRFSDGWDAFEAYRNLPQNVKNQFRITFSNEDDFESFILCGAKGDVVESLWDEAKNNLGEDCFDNLYTVLEIFVSLANKNRSDGKYELVGAEVGSPYNIKEHQCYISGKSQGTVKTCMLPGLYRNGKIIKTSVVEVE